MFAVGTVRKKEFSVLPHVMYSYLFLSKDEKNKFIYGSKMYLLFKIGQSLN